MDYDQFISILDEKGILESDYEEDLLIVDVSSTEVLVSVLNVFNDETNGLFKIESI